MVHVADTNHLFLSSLVLCTRMAKEEVNLHELQATDLFCFEDNFKGSAADEKNSYEFLEKMGIVSKLHWITR